MEEKYASISHQNNPPAFLFENTNGILFPNFLPGILKIQMFKYFVWMKPTTTGWNYMQGSDKERMNDVRYGSLNT